MNRVPVGVSPEEFYTKNPTALDDAIANVLNSYYQQTELYDLLMIKNKMVLEEIKEARQDIFKKQAIINDICGFMDSWKDPEVQKHWRHFRHGEKPKE